MTFKNLGFKELLVIIFILLGLIAFIFEDKFKPTIYEANSFGEGFTSDIFLNVKAYQKNNGDLRITEINVKHDDTEAVAGPAISKLIDNILTTQRLNLDIVAGATYSSEGFIDAFEQAIVQIKVSMKNDNNLKK